jgi:RNA:NAD 2'-phosphotransferase (TPT1/KptA family)
MTEDRQHLVSHCLSWLLRHNVSYYGIHVGATGYVSFQECVEKCRRFRELRLGIREL